ncbi:MAG: fimbria/pilus periplasmic chaperone [Siculibacillus sp.]|nr:fimbria/pilus periplasmic chaperone [Siculibacillus sp.]
MKRLSTLLLIAALTGATELATAARPAHAGSLQVAPVLIDQTTDAPSGGVTLRDVGDRPINVQLRVFRWTQENGADRLTPTDDVVVSPPMITLTPRTDYVVRVVRQTRRPALGEESYRLLVDELPDPAMRAPGTVALLIRQSIPVFFAAPGRSPPNVGWRLVQSGREKSLEATNRGDRRLRVADLAIVDGHGNRVSFGPGLKGYVLGRSSVRWQLPQSGGIGRLRGGLFVTAQTDGGVVRVPLDATRP